MVIQIKEHKYDVDFADIEVMNAVETCCASVVDMAKAADMKSGGIDWLRMALSVFRQSIDAVVGDGVSEECFGTSMNWVDITSAWVGIIDAYNQSCDKAKGAVTDMMKKVSAVSVAKQEKQGVAIPAIRKPVRVE